MYTDKERATIADFHSKQGLLGPSNIDELAQILGKSVASVRAVAVRMGLYTKASAKPDAKPEAAKSEHVLYIEKALGRELPTLTKMSPADLSVLRGYFGAVEGDW